jgi:hypothetical protein
MTTMTTSNLAGSGAPAGSTGAPAHPPPGGRDRAAQATPRRIPRHLSACARTLSLSGGGLRTQGEPQREHPGNSRREKLGRCRHG